MKVIAASELPRFESTRDRRSRLDLVSDAVPVGAKALKADRVVYRPGDTAAPHHHLGCDHFFVVLSGEGLCHRGEETIRLRAGDTAIVRERELHWFENDGDAEFAFVEFWAPPPAETVWADAGDV